MTVEVTPDLTRHTYSRWIRLQPENRPYRYQVRSIWSVNVGSLPSTPAEVATWFLQEQVKADPGSTVTVEILTHESYGDTYAEVEFTAIRPATAEEIQEYKQDYERRRERIRLANAVWLGL